jgi:PQQ-dependent dehydrogenase (methanol/ethanol family)
MRVWRIHALVAVVALALQACGPKGVDGARIEAADKNAEWLTYGRTYSEQRFSPLKQVNRESVGKLGVAWWAEFDTDRGQEATPLVADGVLYTTTAWSHVHAFNAKTGERLWSYDPKASGLSGFNACCDVVNRGVALWKGRVYVGVLDGRLVALDAKTGKVDWSVQTTDLAKPYTITGAPRVVKGRVLIGNGGADYGARGYVSAYDAETGKLDWRFYTAPNAAGKPDGAASDKVLAEKAAATWSDGVWKESGGGGTVWDAITYDPKTDLVYVGVGNGSPWNHKFRSGGKGDNLFLSSIVALKPDTGEYVWHYQTTPGESWDYTATQHIMTADLKIGGATRHVVMQAPKNGFFYVLDAKTGALISADKYAPIDWAERVDLKTGRPVEAPFARYMDKTTSRQIPGPGGAHNWHPMAFSPDEGLVYIPVSIGQGNYADPDSFTQLDGGWNTGLKRVGVTPSNPTKPPAGPPSKARLVAWDPVAKAARWIVEPKSARSSGVLATAGGLVFYSSGGEFGAYDAADGKRLWAYPTEALAIAPASTYEIDGEQYVALMVGYGSGGKVQGRRPGRLLVFKLGGRVKPAPYAPLVEPKPLDLKLAEASTGDAEAGGQAFRIYCQTCHENPRGIFPILPRSPAILAQEDFQTIVQGGALNDTGMISFKRFLTPAQTEDVRAYLLWRARTDAAPAAEKAATCR